MKMIDVSQTFYDTDAMAKYFQLTQTAIFKQHFNNQLVQPS